ncbi:hypothetical protein QPK87_25795 [Kamptonema cortianum]|nr:hypothetical protein [Oscillatoria laete-virens]MDK3159948.1 hypothetical protein [Kamptonema cortianum]MDL5047170.1 hypothetical protein [Oscillatoria amoena NRMC-F 0135]MDL5055497.1 hypothetical protein [Oscillatoria laete-virens NRMC-F 0139]
MKVSHAESVMIERLFRVFCALRDTFPTHGCRDRVIVFFRQNHHSPLVAGVKIANFGLD